MSSTIEAVGPRDLKAQPAEKTNKPAFGKFGTPRPAASDGVIPRAIDGVERAAGTGARRFKVSARPGRKVAAYAQFAAKYILANTAEDAVQCYRDHVGFDVRMEQVAKQFDEPIKEQVEFVVTELAD